MNFSFLFIYGFSWGRNMIYMTTQPVRKKQFCFLKSARNFCPKKKGSKVHTQNQNRAYLEPILSINRKFLTRNISNSKSFYISVKVPQIIKSGIKYIKQTSILKLSIFEKKVIFKPFSGTFLPQYFL